MHCGPFFRTDRSSSLLCLAPASHGHVTQTWQASLSPNVSPSPCAVLSFLFPFCRGSPCPLYRKTQPLLTSRMKFPHMDPTAPSSSQASPASTDPCLLRLVKYYAVIFLWVCLFSSCPVPSFPVQQGSAGWGQDWGGETARCAAPPSHPSHQGRG